MGLFRQGRRNFQQLMLQGPGCLGKYAFMLRGNTFFHEGGFVHESSWATNTAFYKGIYGHRILISKLSSATE